MVVAIVAVLLAPLTPSLHKARFAANVAVCASNQRPIVAGLANYAINSGGGWVPKNGSNSRKPRAYTHHKNLPQLLKPCLGGEDVSDNNWAIDAMIMVCPQGRAESSRNPDPCGEKAISYIMKIDSSNDSSSEGGGYRDPDCDTCVGQYAAGRWYNHNPVLQWVPTNTMPTIPSAAAWIIPETWRNSYAPCFNFSIKACTTSGLAFTQCSSCG